MAPPHILIRLIACASVSLGVAACTDDPSVPVMDTGTSTGIPNGDGGVSDTGRASPLPGEDSGPLPDPDEIVPGTTHCAPVASWASDDTATEREVLRLVNEARAIGQVCGGESFAAASPLSMSPELRCAARLHARDMGINDYFNHQGQDGSSPGDRIERTGYVSRGAGENIAAGARTASSVMAGWLASPGHCRNIMNPAFEQIGVGYWSADGPQWVQVFATPR